MQHAQMILTKKREQKTKLELTGRLDKVGAVTNEVSEVKCINFIQWLNCLIYIIFLVGSQVIQVPR